MRGCVFVCEGVCVFMFFLCVCVCVYELEACWPSKDCVLQLEYLREFTLRPYELLRRKCNCNITHKYVILSSSNTYNTIVENMKGL